MTVHVDESTGYLVIDEIEEGVDILPSSVYRGYLKQIDALKAEVAELKSTFEDEQRFYKGLVQELTEVMGQNSVKAKTAVQLETKIEVLQEQLEQERQRNDELLIGIGKLYACLDTVRNAWYLHGYTAGAWNVQRVDLNDNCKKLKEETVEFPALLESAFSSLASLIDRQ